MKNRNKMKFNLVIGMFLVFCAVSCNTVHSSSATESDASHEHLSNNKGYKIVQGMVEKVGSYADLLKKEDVVYTYTYKTSDNKVNVSTEKYVFENQLSYGVYEQHERTFPQLAGVIEQSYDGTEYWLKSNGAIVDDQELLKKVIFSRHTNFYWFSMFQKMLDPGLNYQYVYEKKISGILYDVVKITFESNDGKPKDIYQLYVNRETKLVDQFLFTVADFGKMDPKLMKLEYEEIDGVFIPTKRKYKASDWNATVSNDPWTTANWTDIKFNNHLSLNDFKK